MSTAAARAAGDDLARRARNHRRRFARRLGVHLKDLDAVTTERLRAWAIAAARLELDSGTEDPRSAEVWWRAHNATSRALRRLEERVRDLGLDRVAGNGNGRPGDLARYVSERYGGSEGER